MSLLSEVPFGSLLSYAPRASDELAVRSQRVRDALKGGRPDLFTRVTMVLRDRPEAEVIRQYLAGNPALVPAPASAPRRDPAALWPALLVCRCLVEAGLGGEVLSCLRRTEAVPKSSFQPRGSRPTAVRHFETMTVDRGLVKPSRIVIVDDVVTKGATLLAAASRVQEAFPEAEVTTFALLRTLGRVPRLERIVDPCTGRLWLRGENADREP